MVQVLARDLRVGDMVQSEGGAVEIVARSLRGEYPLTVTVAGRAEPLTVEPDSVVEVLTLAGTPTDKGDDAAKEVARLEAELNKAIRALPATCYVRASVTKYEVGRKHPLIVVTVTVCQEE